VPDPVEFSPEDVATVKNGFQLIKTQEVAFGEKLYADLFAAKPGLEKLFHGNRAVLIQKFSQMLGNLAFSASRLNRVQGLTHQLGQRHKHYGVDDDDYALFIDVFIATYHDSFPGQFGDTDEDAWRRFLDVVCRHMQEA